MSRRSPSWRCRAAVLTSAALVLTGLAGPAAAEPDSPVAGDEIRVIVELTDEAALATLGADRVQAQRADADDAFAAEHTALREELTSAQDAMIDAATADGIALSEVHRFTDVLNAVVLEVTAEAVADLEGLPGVTAVAEDGTVEALTDVSVPAVGAPQAWEQTDPDGESLRGNGVTVAVIDTGVDYTLPDLGGGFGDGYRVVDGFDFVDFDSDPMDLNAHGTHVAGIIAADGSGVATGVAPEATLTAWRVLDERGGGTESDVIAGIEAAIDPLRDHPADVVNLSLGMAGGDGTDPVGRAATAAADSGVVVAAAAGNAGPGEATLSSPAVADGVLSVGASTTGLIEAELELTSPAHLAVETWRVPLSANVPDTPADAPLIDVGDGTPEDYDQVGDVEGAVVMYRGNPTTVTDYLRPNDYEQARTAEEHGAIAALVYSAGVTPVDGEAAATAPAGLADEPTEPIRVDDLVVMGTTNAEAQAIIAAAEDDAIEATLSPADRTGDVATFSSRGPGPGMDGGIDLVAPGVEIRSLVPADFGVADDLWRFSGTSMAAPHVAGAAALVRQAQPDAGSERVGETLIGTASALPGDDSPLASGAGQLDVAAAVTNSLTASPAVASFGLADTSGEIGRSQAVTLSNAGTEDVTVELELEESTASTGDVGVSPSTVEIPGGGSVQVVLEVAVTDAERAAEVSGAVVGTASSGEVLRIPFSQLVRPLLVHGSPDPAADRTRVIVRSQVPLDDAPAVDVVAPSGNADSLTTEPLDGRPGWYAAELAIEEVGEYTLTSAGDIGGATQHGSGTVTGIEPVDEGPWEQLGRNGSATWLETSTADPDVAVVSLAGALAPYVTTDRGQTWTRTADLPVHDGQGTPIPDPTDPDAFWYAVNARVGTTVLDPTYDGMVLRTEDRGASWQILPFPDQHIEAISSSGTTLSAVVDDGVLRSTDGGESWQHVPVNWPDDMAAVSETMIVGHDLLVRTSLAVLRLPGLGEIGGPTPGAVLWSLTPEDEGVRGLTVHEDTAWVVGSSGTVWRSSDAGESWDEVGIADTGYVTAMGSAHGVVRIAGRGVMASSTDGGQTWTVDDYPVSGPVASDIDAWSDDPDSVLLSLEHAGIYPSSDGGGTYDERLGLPGMTVQDLAVGPGPDGEDVLWVADQHGLGSHPLEHGQILRPDPEWGQTGGEGRLGVGIRSVQPTADSDIWRLRIDALQRGWVGHSTDAGATFTEVDLPSLAMHELAASERHPGSVAVAYTTTGDRGLLVTSDAWASYDVVPVTGQVGEITYDPDDPDILWVASSTGLFRVSGQDRVVEQRLDEPTQTVSIVADGTSTEPDASTVIAGGSGIWRSTDGGETFDAAETPTGSATVSAVTYAEIARREVLIAGTAGAFSDGVGTAGRGVVVSTDGGATWQAASGGLTALSVLSLESSPDGRWVFAGTADGGVHRASTLDLLRNG